MLSYKKKDWASLIELAPVRIQLVQDFFKSDESKQVLKELSEEQILTLIDTAPFSISNNILDKMESLCDADTKFTSIAFKLMKGLYTHGGELNLRLIVKCLPINILRLILDSRIPLTEFHFGTNLQEFFKHILSTISPDSQKDYSYKSLKERDCLNGLYIYITKENGTFPIGRREVFLEIIKSLSDCFSFVQSSNVLDYKKSHIQELLINPYLKLIVSGLQSEIYGYKNDKEIIKMLKNIFEKNCNSKYFLSCAEEPILGNYSNKNSKILPNAEIFEACKVISHHYYYDVFKKNVEENKDNFIDKITRVFFKQCQDLHFIRELNDGVYDKLFNATIEMTVRELIERKESDNFSYCCKLLDYHNNEHFGNYYNPKFDECLMFIKSVISKIFEKSKTLNVDATSYPDICCYLLNTLNNNKISLNESSYSDLNQVSHTALEFLDDEMRNNLVLGIIRHPTDNKKFSHIITSHNPTTLVNYICQLRSVQDIKLILPEAKRGTIDKFGFRETKSTLNPKETCTMNLVEIFLHTLRFWENSSKDLFENGYFSYYQFAKKILKESILTNDAELKKNAINVYYRFSELVSLAKNAKYNNTRVKIANITFLDPLAVIVGSELDKSFVEQYVSKYIRPFDAQSYHSILSEVISKSHIDMNYYDDEEVDNDIDSIFKKINIDEQMTNAIRCLLLCIKQNPVNNLRIDYKEGKKDDFFISKNRILNFIKRKFELLNPKIIDACNPLKTEYPVDIKYNNPNISPVTIRDPEFKMSHLAFLELCRFVSEEFKEYSPKMYKSNLTKSLIEIQHFVKNVSNGRYNVFDFVFTLDQPNIDTSQSNYNSQSRSTINLLYSKPFFEFLNEIDHNQKSIYNDESYEFIKDALTVRFLDENDYNQQKNRPPPKFTGFNISLRFRAHQNAENIFSIKRFSENVEDYKLESYSKTNALNNNLIEMIEKTYNNSKLLDKNPIDDVFATDLTAHKSHTKSKSLQNSYNSRDLHQCYFTIIDALNKCKAENFFNEYDSINYLKNFGCITTYVSKKSSYTMLTQLFDLLINDFLIRKKNISKTYGNRVAKYDDAFYLMVIVAQVATPNIGKLNNLEKISQLNEKTIAKSVLNSSSGIFESIFLSKNIDQILICMNSSLFSNCARRFSNSLLKQTGLLESKKLINTLINEVVNNGKKIHDDFQVALASCSIHPSYVGFPAPQTSLEYLKMITNGSTNAKRAACANAVYYAIMNYMSDQPIPINEIIEIIQSAHQKSPDEITAFFCIMISEDASLTKMRSMPALNDLMIEEALPNHYIINQGPKLNIPKEIGGFYYKVVEQIILSGLKSQKVHIYDLAVTILNEINVGTEICQKISHFIENGLKGIQPNDDNRTFLAYATSYILKNPQFTSCFESYCEALSKIQKHSFAILKANAHMNSDSPYPVSFKKLEDSYLTIINIIEKPFIEFTEENEMISCSQFCRKLIPVLNKNRPAVARNIYLRLESYASIFGDQLVEEMIQLYKNDKKEEALSKFIQIVTHHEELVIGLPQSIKIIYQHLNSAFTTKHSIELSKNLDDSSSKPPFSLQRASELAEMFSADVISHIPDKGEGKITNEDELVQILSNLGIFCMNVEREEEKPIIKQNKFYYKKNISDSSDDDDDYEDDEEKPPLKKKLCPRAAKAPKKSRKAKSKILSDEEEDFDDDDDKENKFSYEPIKQSINFKANKIFNVENDVANIETEAEEEKHENELDQNQINDAYNLFF